MPEYRFSLTLIFSYKNKVFNSFLIWENTYQRKPLFLNFWHSEEEVGTSGILTLLSKQDWLRCQKSLVQQQNCFSKFFKIHRETLFPQSFFNKVAGCRLTVLLKETPEQVFSWLFTKFSWTRFYIRPPIPPKKLC